MGVPISNAKDVLLSENVGTLPNMSNALLDWLQPIRVIKVVKTLVNYDVIERGDPVDFQGVIQPLSGKQLAMKPDGQRSFDWETVHSLTNLGLITDDIVWIQNTRYRVMTAKPSLKNYGFYYYEVMQDYQDQAKAPPIPSDTAEKFSQDILNETSITIDVSATITDAFATIWKLLDLDDANSPVIGAIQVISETEVMVTPPTLGNYRLLGVS